MSGNLCCTFCLCADMQIVILGERAGLAYCRKLYVWNQEISGCLGGFSPRTSHNRWEHKLTSQRIMAYFVSQCLAAWEQQQWGKTSDLCYPELEIGKTGQRMSHGAGFRDGCVEHPRRSVRRVRPGEDQWLCSETEQGLEFPNEGKENSKSVSVSLESGRPVTSKYKNL